MPDAEPTVERQELSERVLGIIGGHRMGTVLNAQDLFTKGSPGAPPPDAVPVSAGTNRDGVHVAGDERRTLAT